MASITYRQKHYDVEQDVEINGELKTVTANMTLNLGGKVPSGSLSAKITSSMLTDRKADRDALRKAWLQIFDEAAYDADNSLFNQVSQATELKVSGNPKQTTLTGEFDKLKAAAGKDDDIISDAVIVEDEPADKPASKSKAKATAAKDKPDPKKRTVKRNPKVDAVVAKARARKTEPGIETAKATVAAANNRAGSGTVVIPEA